MRKNGQIVENTSMCQEVIRQKIVSNVILVFLDHMKPRIFFVGQRWWPTESAPIFQISGSAPGISIPSFLKFFALLFYLLIKPSALFLMQCGKRICHFNTY